MTKKVDRLPVNYTRTPIANASAMLGTIVKIVGSVRASAPAFTSPLTHASCVWYETRVDPWRPELAQGPPIVETRSQDLYVDDDTGSAFVHMERAEVRLGSMNDPWQVELPDQPGSWIWGTWGHRHPPDTMLDRMLAKTPVVQEFLSSRGVDLFNRPETAWEELLGVESVPPSKRKARFREDVLHEGTKVAVLGRAFQEPDPTTPSINQRQPALRVVFGTAPYGIVVSNEPDDLW